MGLFNKDKKVKDLESEVEFLKGKVESAEAGERQAVRNENQIRGRMEDLKIEHEVNCNNLLRANKVYVNDLEATIKEFKDNNQITIDNKLIELENNAVDTSNKQDKEHADRMRKLESDYQVKTDKLESTHADRMRKLEATYVEKLSKLDTKLESDKASFRKYMRTENNKLIDTLETENKKLVKENAILTGEVTGMKGTSNVLSGQLSSMASSFDKLLVALPTVSASITTPEVVVQLPKQEPVKGNNGGEQKKG